MKKLLLTTLLAFCPMASISSEIDEGYKQYAVDFANAVLREHAYRTKELYKLDLSNFVITSSPENLLVVKDKINREIMIVLYPPVSEGNNNLAVSFFVNSSDLLEIMAIFPVPGILKELKKDPDKWLHRVISYPGDI